MNKTYLSILIFFSVKAFGAGVEVSGVPLRKVTASGVEVPIFDQVRVHTLKLPLKLSGGGIREKKVVLASVNVYFLLSYMDLTGPLDTSDPLKSLDKSRDRVLRMTFLRDVGAEKIKDSFSDALTENAVSLTEPGIQSVLQGLKFDVKKGGGVDIVGHRPPSGPERLQLIFQDKTVQTIEAEGKTLVTDFWKIWFGKPADGGLEDLKPRLLSLDQLMHM